MIAIIALGSNLGDRRKYLEDAMNLLQQRGIKIVKRSFIHETKSVGNIDQPDFLNMVIEVFTCLEPEELLRVCLGVENDLGRVREKKWGSRTIDIDVLLYQDKKIDTEFLQIPHPRMHERKFVLEPLAEILRGDQDYSII